MFRKFVAALTLAALLGFSVAGCANKAQQGAGAGALAGATLGALVAGNKVQGALIGAGVGLLLGYVVGNEWDKADAKKLNNTLETQPSGSTSRWTNPDTGKSYAATPSAAYTGDAGKVYRDVSITTDDGKTVKAKAWRDENGEWHLVQ